ncbi:hypothetical protein STCU_07019 [Strigomonas culicis]|uniref:Uncharacterized protein n=1 Tax=Strigomonas culicis TaxID=28005 RepID=S9U774_9TRYP|nr:hypothetical protein STCU_07019 [Strigomonas culicis]|eukprot:EPY24758.1 hypothetical protein STCU_07019 [Strigomonas culicis]
MLQNYYDNLRRDGEAEERRRLAHVPRIVLPYGRRTGLVYGEPALLLTSEALFHFLVASAPADRGGDGDADESARPPVAMNADGEYVNALGVPESDYRHRIYFSAIADDAAERLFHIAQLRAIVEQLRTAEAGEGGAAVRGFTIFDTAQQRVTMVEETVEAERAAALQHLCLDRYLYAPDLLYDIARLHQRRVVTARDRVLLDSFVDADDDEDNNAAVEEAEEAEDDGMPTTRRGGERAAKRGARRKTRKTRKAAGELRDLGRGSMQNMPIQKPYVEGRRL